jgi:hypothetical protein
MKDFLQKAIVNSNHHAKSVLNTIPTLYGNLYIRGCEFKKTRSTCLWIELDNKPYYVTYDHEYKQILFKDKNCHGNVVARFDDNMNWINVKQQVDML